MAILAGCAKDPSARDFLSPKLGDVSADVESFRIRLSCQLSGDLSTISRSGFYFGISQAEMKFYDVPTAGQSLALEMKALDASTPYYVAASISNGDVEIRTDIVCITTKAGEETVLFDDDFFKRYILTNFDANSDGVLTLTEASKITEIHVDTDSVVSIKGIEKMPELLLLDAYGKTCKGRLASLDVSHNPKLYSLNVGENQIPEIDLTQNKFITYLNLNNNPLTKMPQIQHLTQLTELHLSTIAQYMEKDFLRNFPMLWSVNFCGLTADEIDLSQNTRLKWVWCQNLLKVTTLDLSACPDLLHIDALGGKCLKTIILSSSAHPEDIILGDGVEVRRK